MVTGLVLSELHNMNRNTDAHAAVNLVVLRLHAVVACCCHVQTDAMLGTGGMLGGAVDKFKVVSGKD